MTLKSKKLVSNQKHHRRNIRSKQKVGGAKYTVLGHDAPSVTLNDNQSDLYEHDDKTQNVYSKYDLQIIQDFLRNAKGDQSDVFEFSDESKGKTGASGSPGQETKFNDFIEGLQKIFFKGTFNPNPGVGKSKYDSVDDRDKLLVRTDTSDSANSKPDRKADGSGKKDVEINIKFLKDVLGKISRDTKTIDYTNEARLDASGQIKRSEKVLGDKIETQDKSKAEEQLEGVGTVLEDLRQIYSKYHEKYLTSGDTSYFESNIYNEDGPNKSGLRKEVKQQYYSDLSDKNENDIVRFKTLKTADANPNDGENYYFADLSDEETISYLKHKFPEYTPEELKKYAKKQREKNVTSLGSLGEGVIDDTSIDEFKGKLGFEIIDVDSQEIRDRYEWCYLMERIYLFKHMELLQLVINISYIINSLFIMYFLFSRVVQLRNIASQPCPVPKQVVLPPTYREIIQNYFNTQRGDLIHINDQIQKTVVGIQTVLNKSMGVSNEVGSPNGLNGIPLEYKNMAVSSDFLNRPLSFGSYNHLIKSHKLHIPTIYLFKNDNFINTDVTDSLIKKIIDLYPNEDFKKHLVISVSAHVQDKVYRSRKDAANNYTGKYRYVKATHSPLKIIVSKADSYENIVKFFETLCNSTIIPGLNKDECELSYVQYKQKNEDFYLNPANSFQIKSDPSGDKIELNNASKLQNGDKIVFKYTAGNVNSSNTYYVIDNTNNQIQISDTRNGPAVQFTGNENKELKNGTLQAMVPPNEVIKVSNYYDSDDGAIIVNDLQNPGNFYIKNKDDNTFSGSGSITPDASSLFKTGDVRYTASIIVNLQRIPIVNDNTIRVFLANIRETHISNDRKVDILYFNLLRNQLKLVIGFPETFNVTDINLFLGELVGNRSNLFKLTDDNGDISLADPTRDILFTSILNSSKQAGGSSSRDDNQEDSKFKGHRDIVYPAEDPRPVENKLKEYDFGYNIGSSYKIPYGINDGKIEKFLKDMGSDANENPYKLANQNNVYEKFRFESRTQIDNFVTQYKNIKELVIDSKSNNAQLKNMIEFLNDDSKTSLHEFKEQVLQTDLEIKEITPSTAANTNPTPPTPAGPTKITLKKPHNLQNGDMITINDVEGTGAHLLNNRSFEVTINPANKDEISINVDTSKFTATTDFTENTGIITSFVDEHSIHDLSKMTTKFEGEDLYTPEHIQIYLNRCYELEKLYIVKHHEFLYMKNIFDKSFIFYLMTFIVFFYYIKSLGLIERKKCEDSVIKLPKTFLGDIELMVKNQAKIMKTFDESDTSETTPFKIIKKTVDVKTEKDPGFILSGGFNKALNMIGGDTQPPPQPKSGLENDDLLTSVKVEIYELLDFIAEHKEKFDINKTTLEDVHNELLDPENKAKLSEYENAKERLDIIKNMTKGIGKDSEKAEKMYRTNEYYKNFIQGNCLGAQTLDQVGLVSSSQRLCENAISIDIDKTIFKVLVDVEKHNITFNTRSHLENSLSQLRIDDESKKVDVRNIFQDHEIKYTKRIDKIKRKYNAKVSEQLLTGALDSRRIEESLSIYKAFLFKQHLEYDVDTSTISIHEKKESGKGDLIKTIKMSKDELILFGFKFIENDQNTLEFDTELQMNSDNDLLSIVQNVVREEAIRTKKIIDNHPNFRDIFFKLITVHNIINPEKGESYFQNSEIPQGSDISLILNNYFYILKHISDTFYNGLITDLNNYININKIKSEYDINDDKSKYYLKFLNALNNDENINFVINITTPSIYDCIAAMSDILKKFEDKIKFSKIINENKNLKILINDFLEPYFKISTLRIKELTRPKKNLQLFLLKLLDCYFGSYSPETKGKNNKEIIQDLKTDDNPSLGNTIYNVYKNYLEFKRLTQDIKVQSFTYGKEAQIPEGQLGILFKNDSEEIIRKFEVENTITKKIIDILKKFYIPGVTTYEFLSEYYTKFFSLESGESNFNDDYNNDDFNVIINKETKEELLKLNEDLNKEVNKKYINDLSKEIATFREKMMGAARVFVLIRDTANQRVPPETLYQKQYLDEIDATTTNSDKKKFNKFLLSLEDGKVKDKFSVNPDEYSISETNTINNYVLGNYENIKTKEKYSGVEIKKKDNGQTVNHFIYNPNSTKNYRAIGDTLIHPLSEKPEEEGMYEDNKGKISQKFESECVFMPSKAYLGIQNKGFDPYPCNEKMNDASSPGKVYGPFRRAVFHSEPSILFNKEFGDVNTNIQQGNSVVFFGYGFSGSGKTYTLMDDEAPGFLKTIVEAQIKDGAQITEVYAKELYPYFPAHLEFESTEEGTLFKKNKFDGTIITKSNKTKNIGVNKPYKNRIRESCIYQKANKSSTFMSYEHDILTYVEDKSDGGKKIKPAGLSESGNEDIVNSSKYPFVEIELFKVNSDNSGNPKHNLKLLGGDDNDISSLKLSMFNSKSYRTNAFNSLINTIARKRKQLLQVSATPNNPDSSRSHLFIKIKFKQNDGKEGELTIVDMAGAENTIQIQKQFLLKDDDNELVEVNSKLSFDFKNNGVDISPTDIDEGYVYLQNKSFFNNLTKEKKYQKSMDSLSANSTGCELSNFFELIYKYIARDQVSHINKQSESILTLCGLNLTYLFKGNTLRSKVIPDLVKINKNIFKKKLETGVKEQSEDPDKKGEPYIDPKHVLPNSAGNNDKSLYSRYLHHFPTFGCNGGGMFNAIKVFFIFTVFDIALALNYKPIGLTSLFNMFLNNTFDKEDLKEINPKKIGNLIQTFEEKISKSIEKVQRPLPDTAFKKKQDINYNVLFDTKGNTDQQKALIIDKIAVQLDLHYLIDGETLLSNNDAIKDYTDPSKYAIYSPFVWIYYRVKEIFSESTKTFKELILLKLAFSYINLIVEQGRGIVTSLEHLKYFFLYNTNQQEGLYGYNFKQVDPNARFLHEADKPVDYNDWLEKSENSELSNAYNYLPNLDNNKKGYNNKYEKCNLLTQSSIYYRPIPVGDGEQTNYILEKVNKGNIKRVKMLQNLMYFGGNCGDNEPESCNISGQDKNLSQASLFSNYKDKPFSEIKEKYPYIKYLKNKEENDRNYKKSDIEQFNVIDISVQGVTKKDNTYIMMAHIMRGVFDKDGYISRSDRQKYCDASKSTLEFAESIKSDVGICKSINTIVPNRYSSKVLSYNEQCSDLYKVSSIENLKEYFKKIFNNTQRGGYYNLHTFRPETTCSIKVVAVPKNFNLLNKELSRSNRLVGFNNNSSYNKKMNTIMRLLSHNIKTKKNTINLKPRIRSKRRKSCNRNSRQMIKYYKK